VDGGLLDTAGYAALEAFIASIVLACDNTTDCVQSEVEGA
jgi:hypothetical protein